MPASLSPLDCEDLASWRACTRRFWLDRHASVSPHPSSREDRTRDPALRASYPQAVMVPMPTDEASWSAAIERTESTLAAGWLAGTDPDAGRAIIGACLRSNEGARVRIDVLAAGPYGLKVFKLRQATVGHDSDVDEVALWVHVAARAGLRVQSAGLLLIDTDFVYPGLGCYAGLFREVELMPVLGSRPVAAWLVAMRAAERGTEPPAPEDPPCHHPAPCRHLAHCGTPSGTAASEAPDSLEIVGRELAAELREAGHASLKTVSLDAMPDERRRRAVRAVQRGGPVLEPAAGEEVRAMGYPRFFLRIDTIGFARPIWPGTSPYQVLPFQWSCDVEREPGDVHHQAFLATAQGDPRRAFATSLLSTLGERGPIIAYNAGFERNRIRELGIVYPDLVPALEALGPRIVDLFQLARAHYYHPQMCGSWSFKSFVRAIAPEMDADRFQWEQHTEAQEAFAASILEPLAPERLDALRLALLAYGERQTRALRHAVQCFAQAVTA
jgi:hypothetical protein